MNATPPRSAPGFFGAFSMPFRGIGFVIRNPRLARIWIIPVLIVVLLLMIGCGSSLEIGRILADRWTPEAGEGAIGAVFGRIGHGLARLVLTFVGVAVSILVSIVLAPVVAAPFNDAFGEEVELRELGKVPAPFSWSRLGRDVGRTIRLEAAKLGIYAAIVGPLSIIGIFVGPLGIVASVLGFLFTAAYFALDYVDGPLSRRNVGVRRRFHLLARYPAQMFGFGIGVWFLLVVPLFNLFFMPAAVAGGTILCIRLGLLEDAEPPMTDEEAAPADG